MKQWNSENDGCIPVAQTSLKPALYTEYQLLGHLGLLDTVLTIVFMIFKVQQGRNKKVTSNYKNDYRHCTNMSLRKPTGCSDSWKVFPKLLLCLRLWGDCNGKPTALEHKELISHYTATKIYVSSQTQINYNTLLWDLLLKRGIQSYVTPEFSGMLIMYKFQSPVR